MFDKLAIWRGTFYTQDNSTVFNNALTYNNKSKKNSIYSYEQD